MQANASSQNATYINTFKCIRMLLYAAREKCNRRKCNENVENALKCTKMLKNAYGKKPHHFREKTPLIPASYRAGPTARAAITQHGLYILRGSPRHTCSHPARSCHAHPNLPLVPLPASSVICALHGALTLYMVAWQWGPLQPIHRLLSCLTHAGSTAHSSRHVFTQRSGTQCLTR